MASLSWLSLLIFFPLGGSLFVLMATTSQNARQTALFVSLITFFLSLFILFNFDLHQSGFQYIEKISWFASYNIFYQVGIDGLSLSLILLSTFLIPVCIIGSWNNPSERIKEFLVAFLALESFTLGTFCALDILLFYVFFEAVLIPMFFIIGIWGGQHRLKATFKFFLYTLAGSLGLLIALIGIIFETGTSDMAALSQYDFNREMQNLLWVICFLAFAIKTPMFPVHTWLPDAHSEAPTAGSMILAGILLKMGGYGMIRFCLGFFPKASIQYQPIVFILSIVAVIYASLVAWRQQDIKRLVAYSSIAHMGYVTAGIFLSDLYGLQGSMIQMISHGLISAALFLMVGMVYDRTHTRQIKAYGGLMHVMPKYCYGLLFFSMASLGLPGTSGFIGEFLVILSAYKQSGLIALGLAMGMIFSALYMLSFYKKMALGPLSSSLLKLTDINKREFSLILTLGGLILWGGIYPQPLIHLLNQSTFFSAPTFLEDNTSYKMENYR